MTNQKRRFSETSSSSSLLQTSEAAFPRGGASSLTPLELKEVANEAARDVLFETANAKKSVGGNENQETPKNKKKRLNNKKSSSSIGNEDNDEEKIYIEHLNSKNLVAGTLVLGQVLEITKHFISLALPDNLVGFVHISNISDEVSDQIGAYEDKIEKQEDEDEEDGAEEDKEEDVSNEVSLPHPKDFVEIGQWLRAVVVETTQRNSRITKKQLNKVIELSIVPSLVNKTLQPDLDFVIGQTIQASVKSVEDHGLVLNVGKNGDMTGFISKKELANSGFSLDAMRQGSVFLFIMNKKPTNSKRVVTLSLDFSGLSKKKLHHSVDTISSIDAVIPGNIVESIVINVSDKGVAVKVFGTIKGCLTLPSSTIYTAEGLKSKYKVGEKFKSKVEASIIVEGHMQILLTLLPHVLSFKKTPYLDSFKPLEAFPIGFLLEKVTVKAFDGVYLYADIDGVSITGRVHISKITGSKTIKPSILNAKYFSGSTHQAKILGYSNFDNQYILSMEPNILTQKYLRAQDIPVGEFFIGSVEKVSGSEGMVLKAFDDVFSVFVPVKHISDIKLVYPERKFKIGSKVKGRVLSVNSNNKIIATLKKTLVNLNDSKETNDDPEKSKILSSFDKISVGDKSAGTVEGILTNGAIVSFFGGVKGFLPKSEISEAFVKHPQDFLKIGQSIAIKVIMIDSVTKKMTVSCKSKSQNSKGAITNCLESLRSGRSILKLKIAEKTLSNLILESDGVRALLESNHLSDKNFEQNRKEFKALKKGDELEVLVLDKDKKSQLAIVTAKQSLLEDAKQNKLPTSFKDISSLNSQVEIHGYIRSVTPKGLFVGFGGKLVGLLLKKYASKNKSIELDQIFKKNQSITCHVIRKDEENERFLLSMNDSKENKSKHQITENDSNYIVEIGQTVPGKVISIDGYYLIIKLVHKKIGYCHITDALVNYDQTLHEAYKVGKIVNAFIASYDINLKRYSVSLRNNFTEKVVDKAINSIDDLAVGDIIRGFVKNINNNGIYVSLNSDLYALVRVSDLFDDFVKNWRSKFKINQVIKGRIISLKGEGRILLTMKESLMTGELNLSKCFDDLKVGEIFEGSVKSVTEFGVFVKLDGTNNISGLSHRSQISDDRVVENLDALFGEGDRVKVKILTIDPKKKQLSLGMKASYFVDNDEEEDTEMKDVNYEGSEEEDSDQELLEEAYNDEAEAYENDDELVKEDTEIAGFASDEYRSSFPGLSTNGFDWTANILDQVDDRYEENDDYMIEVDGRKKNKKVKNQIVEDRTSEMNSRAPQSAADFERLLIGEPNSSVLWMNYMSFQIQLSEIQKAREIGERALKTINYREEQEKLNIWIAMLNLENSFGSKESLQNVFNRSIQYMDNLTMHQKLVGIYILSEKYEEAESLFKIMIKKFSDEVSVWFTFGKFYMENKKFDEAHELLARALKSLPLKDHIEIVKRFAQLEFNIGDAEQARSLFEGLIADKPKRFDLWNVYIDQEIKKNEKQKVEDLFERLIIKKLSNKQKKFFFSKWLRFEEKMGDKKACDYVKAKAKEIAEAS